MKLAVCALLFLAVCESNVLAEVPSECQGSPADIVFILDSSASIWPADFLRQISFVKNVTDQFNIGPSPSNTRVGIVTFGHTVQPQFQLKDNLNKKDLSNAVKNIKHMYGRRTNTGDAIDYVVNNMFTPESGSRQDVNHITIVITDGRSQDVLRTNSAAAAAHKAGIKTFAIGVGKRLDFEELNQIASDPDTEYVFNVTNYRALLNMAHRFVTETCRVTAAPTLPVETTTPLSIQDLKCEGKPADLFFLIDGSSSIDPKNFNKELDFVQKVVKMFDIGVTETRVGMLIFSHEAKMLIPLDNDMDKDTLLQEILNIKHIGGGTNTAEALRLARQEGFARNVVRPNVPKIAIVLTDGLSADEDETADEAKLMHQTDITTFAIGIGYGVDLVEIKAIASNPDEQFVFEVGDFNSLDSIKDLLVNKACSVKPSEVKEKPKELACRVNQNTDIMFIYDTSAMGERQSMAISQFVGKVVSHLDIAGGHLHVGRVTENCPSGANFQLTDKLTELDFSNVRYSNYATMIKKVRRTGFNAENGGHKVSNNIGVLFIDNGISGDLNGNTLEEAKALSHTSEVFVVSIGRDPVLDQFTSQFNRRNVLSINSYVGLENSVDSLLAMFCSYVQNKGHQIVVPPAV